MLHAGDFTAALFFKVQHVRADLSDEVDSSA